MFPRLSPVKEDSRMIDNKREQTLKTQDRRQKRVVFLKRTQNIQRIGCLHASTTKAKGTEMKTVSHANQKNTTGYTKENGKLQKEPSLKIVRPGALKQKGYKKKEHPNILSQNLKRPKFARWQLPIKTQDVSKKKITPLMKQQR